MCVRKILIINKEEEEKRERERERENEFFDDGHVLFMTEHILVICVSKNIRRKSSSSERATRKRR